MIRHYAIGCHACKQYLDLSGQRPFEGIDGCSFVPVAAYKQMSVTASDLRRQLCLQAPDSMVPGLANAMQSFFSDHESHGLCVYESQGDFPWWPDEPDWCAWREVRGPFFKPPFRETDIDLPLNIILDLGITSWSDALNHYRSTCPCIENPEALESVFNEALKRRA